MSTTLWNSTITRIGIDAVEMIHSGVFILFGEPVPEALADVSIVHDRASSLARLLQAGDQFVFGGQTYVLDEVGGRASDNLTELGHVVIYVDQPDLGSSARRDQGVRPGTAGARAGQQHQLRRGLIACRPTQEATSGAPAADG